MFALPKASPLVEVTFIVTVTSEPTLALGSEKEILALAAHAVIALHGIAAVNSKVIAALMIPCFIFLLIIAFLPSSHIYCSRSAAF